MIVERFLDQGKFSWLWKISLIKENFLDCGNYFPLITQKPLMLQPWHFAAFSYMLLETFLPNLVFLTCPSPQILGKTQMIVFLIYGFLVNPCHKSWTSDDIGTKLGQETEIDKKNKTKKIDDDVMKTSSCNIVIFPVCGQFRRIWKPDSERIVCRTFL